MACYISSGNNRHYAAIESTFGHAAGVTASNRFTSLGLRVSVKQERVRRRDKTGTRTFQGISGELRKQVAFQVATYLYQRDLLSPEPRYGALVEAALGSSPMSSAGGTTIAAINGRQIEFGCPHGLTIGQALAVGGEIRFVESTSSPTSVVVSAPLDDDASAIPPGKTVSYPLAHDLKSFTIYDYWSPETAVQRILPGSAVNEMRIDVNGDFHEITFAGEAAELVDNRTFQVDQAGLTQFPPEPGLAPTSEAPIPGHLGQVWLGSNPEMVHTIKSARITVVNNIEFRRKDFGSLRPRCIIPGDREVSVELEMYSQDRAAFNELYEAAKLRSSLPLTLQLGNAPGQLCGVWIPNFVPEVPEFLDDEPRLRWRVRASQAQGVAEDELYVAFA